MNLLRCFDSRAMEPVDETVCALLRPWLFGLADEPWSVETRPVEMDDGLAGLKCDHTEKAP